MPLTNSSPNVNASSSQNANTGTNQQSSGHAASSNNNASSSGSSASSGPFYMPIIPTLGCHSIQPGPATTATGPAAAPPPTAPPGKAVITRLGTDGTIQRAGANIHENRNPQEFDMSPEGSMAANSVPTRYDAPVSHKDVDYSQAGQFAPIVITGHMGSKIPIFGVNVWMVSDMLASVFDKVPSWAPQWLREATNLHATNFEDKSPKEIVKHLIKHGLPRTYAGVIYLDGCSGAYGQEASFAAEVYRRLVENGYFYLQIKSNLGEAGTDEQGQEHVTWPEAQWRIRQAKKRGDVAKEEYDKLRRASPDYQRYIKLFNNENEAISILAGLESQLEDATPDQVTEDLIEKIVAAKIALQAAKAEFRKFCAGPGRKFAELAEERAEQEAKHEDLNRRYVIKNLTGTWGPERLPGRGLL